MTARPPLAAPTTALTTLVAAAFCLAGATLGHARGAPACPHYAQVSAPPVSVRPPLWAAKPASPPAILPTHPRIRYTGRIDWTGPAPLLGWAAAAIQLRFTGTTVAVNLRDAPCCGAPDWVDVSIDAGPAVAVRLTSADTTYTFTSNLSAATHDLLIVKRTEGWRGNIAFGGVTLGAGHLLVPLPPAAKFRMEFYGDSNVAGYDDQDMADRGFAKFNDAAWSYPAIVARMFAADHHNLGWSGAGMTAQSSPVEQDIWNRTNPLRTDLPYDFSKFAADVVVINAGSNDSYVFDNRIAVIAGWQDLILNKIRPVHSHAHIVLADSYGWSFIEPANYLAQAVAALNAAGEANVSWVSWPWLFSEKHALVEEQAGFANILAAHIAQVLGCPAPIPNTIASFAPNGQITNGGFETVPIGLGRAKQAAGWRQDAAGNAQVGVITGNGAHDGGRFLRLVVGLAATPKPAQAQAWQATPATAGRLYSLTGWARGTPGAAASLRIDFANQAQQVIGTTTGAITLTPGWTRYTTSGLAPAGTWSASARMDLNAIAAIADFDDVAMVAQ